MKTVAKENLLQIKDLLIRMTKDEYGATPDVLSGATIGQHVRHILEFYTLLVSGSNSGVICYDNRERDIKIETDPVYAIQTIDKLFSMLDKLDEDLQVILKADYSAKGLSENNCKSSVARELAYCIEHSIHHQALIKAGLIALGLLKLTNEHFGIAYSTIRYRNNVCAQ